MPTYTKVTLLYYILRNAMVIRLIDIILGDFGLSLGVAKQLTSEIVLKRMESQKYAIFSENHWTSIFLDMDIIFLDNDVK